MRKGRSMKKNRLRNGILSFIVLCLCGCSQIVSEKEETDPYVPQERKVLQTLPVQKADGSVISLQISDDPIPEEAYTEPEHKGTVEQFYYNTRTYGLYGVEDKAVKKYAEVYLPYGYEKGKQYKIAYLMHGAGGNAERFFGSPDEPRRLNAIVDNMIASGEMEPMIFVTLTYYPDNEEHEHMPDWDATYTKAFGQELRNDVIPQVEENYDLHATREDRLFGGFSMGSVTTYYRMCDCMDLFAYYLGMSGSLLWGADHPDKSDISRYLIDQIKAQGYTDKDFFLYSSSGTEDFADKVVKAQVEAEKEHPEFFHFGEDGQPANVVYQSVEGADHDSANTDRVFYNFLPQLSKLMN